MKRFRAYKNSCIPKLPPFYYKEKRAKLKNNSGSTFLRVKLSSSKPVAETGDQMIDSYFKFTESLSHVYMIEFDRHQNAEPHFHLWRTNGFSKISDTRSPAITLKTGAEKGVVYTYKERKKEAHLNDIQSREIVEFVEENRFALYLMIHAFKHYKVKSFEDMDTDFLLSLFSKAELYAIKQKYAGKYDYADIPELFQKQ